MNFIENLLAKSINFELDENEKIIHQGGANLFRSNDVSGGILYLTNERLIFIPNKININKSRQDIEIDDIVSIKEVRTLIINNGLVIESKDDSKFRFV